MQFVLNNLKEFIRVFVCVCVISRHGEDIFYSQVNTTFVGQYVANVYQ